MTSRGDRDRYVYAYIFVRVEKARYLRPKFVHIKLFIQLENFLSYYLSRVRVGFAVCNSFFL